METANFFNVHNPNEMQCSVWSVRNWQRILVVRLSEGRAQPPLWLVFTLPIYFEGPMMWKGAAFELGSDEDKLKFWEPLRGTTPQEKYLKRYHLFQAQVRVVPTHITQIKILAMKARLLQNDQITF